MNRRLNHQPWTATFDQVAKEALAIQKAWEGVRWRGRGEVEPEKPTYKVTEHPMYFSLFDVRPAAITKKKEPRSADTYDFAAHANPATTDRHYDRRKVRRASAAE